VKEGISSSASVPAAFAPAGASHLENPGLCDFAREIVTDVLRWHIVPALPMSPPSCVAP